MIAEINNAYFYMDSKWLHTKRKIEALASQYPIGKCPNLGSH